MTNKLNSSSETRVRIFRGISPESKWLNCIQHALWERFGGQIRLIEQPTLTMLGSGELSSMRQKYRDIGSLATHQLIDIFNDNKPKSFDRPVIANTRGLYVRHVRQYTDGTPKLALGFDDAHLSTERKIFAEALDRSLGKSHPWNHRYTPNLSIAEVIGNIPFDDLLEGVSDFQTSKLELGEGDILDPS